jgi:hypothetical protein
MLRRMISIATLCNAVSKRRHRDSAFIDCMVTVVAPRGSDVELVTAQTVGMARCPSEFLSEVLLLTTFSSPLLVSLCLHTALLVTLTK